MSPEGQVFKGEENKVLCFLADWGRGKGKMKMLEKQDSESARDGVQVCSTALGGRTVPRDSPGRAGDCCPPIPSVSAKVES